MPIKINPDLDLQLDRVVDVKPHLVWQAWTRPEYIRHWFVPRPWTIGEVEVDLRPGGRSLITMISPEGEKFPNEGCYLELVENKRLVFTDALLAGWRPAEKAFFTGVIEMEAAGSGTRYTATAIHRDKEGRDQHEAMGFYTGWGTCLDQLVEFMAGK